MTFQAIQNNRFSGKHHTEATKRKIALANFGKIVSEHTKNRLSMNNARAMLGKRHTEETLRKMSEVKRGKHQSLETRRKISEAHKGVRPSLESRRKMSDAIKGAKHPNYGKHLSKETRIKISKSRIGTKNPFFGKRHTEETRRKIGDAHRGENNHNWEGGITPINKKIRNSIEYRLWRDAVFKRDNWTCIWCGAHGVKLNADHIKRFSDYPELRFAIDNGRTLCEHCHKRTDTFGNKKQIKVGTEK